MNGQSIPALTAEQLACSSNVHFGTKKDREALVEHLKEMKANTAGYQELQRSYEILLSIATSSGIAKFEGVVDRVITLFEKEELFRPSLLSPEGKPIFHRHLLDVLQYWYGPEKPFRANPLDVLGKWLYNIEGDDPLLQKIKEERKTRSQQPVFLKTPRGESGANDKGPNRDVIPTDAVQPTVDQPDQEVAGNATAGCSSGASEHVTSRPDEPVKFSSDQLAAAKELQALRHASSNRSPNPRDPPFAIEAHRQEPAKHDHDVGLSATHIPELLFDWRRATWNSDVNSEDRVSGDKALNTAYSSTAVKFCENNTGLVITSVHTAFVQICVRYKLTKTTALSYISLLYGGTAHVDYLAYLERCSEDGTRVGLDLIFEHMESLYDTRQSRTMAKESLADLRFQLLGTRVEALDAYERAFRKLQAGAGRLTEDTLLHNLQFALRDKNVDFADVVSSQISSGQYVSFSNAIAALRAAAATADAKRPRNANLVDSDTFASEAFGRQPTELPPFDNRRLSKTFKRWSKLAKGGGKSNPIDRKTGKPMVCRSVGCNSTEHLQYSGRCPVQQRREKQGSARTYMAATIQEDIAEGVAVEDILTEILFSQENESANESDDDSGDADGIIGLTEDELDQNLENESQEQNFRQRPAKSGIFGQGLDKWWRS